MTDEERAIRLRLRDDFAHYAAKCLKIRTKTQAIGSLALNQAQRHIHQQVEAQRSSTGKVRAIILKGRQQGCSTYTEGRFYWRVSHLRGVRAFILTHEDEATANLFDMAKRFHEHCPAPVKPSTRTENAKELTFDLLDSSYKVGTAGNRAVGRSQTVQFFHGSEVGFWPHAAEHAAGILQAIPDGPDTEVFLESTANGIGNYFHQQWQLASAGQSEFIPIFVPWFWQDEYRKEPDADFSLTAEEIEYQQQYELDIEQMCWRRYKIADLQDDTLFRQEYPATAAEAFQVAGLDPFIRPEAVIKARKAKADPHGARILGVDPARFGDDRTALVERMGRAVVWQSAYAKKDTMEVVGLVLARIKESNPDRIFVDVGGLGAGVYDRLREVAPHPQRVVAVNSGEKPMDGQRYGNKRAEMWGEMKAWLYGDVAVQIPDDDEMQADLCNLKYRYDSNQRLFLERKEDMKKRGFRSPDKGDALALTFALPVNPERKRDDRPLWVPGSAGWMS